MKRQVDRWMSNQLSGPNIGVFRQVCNVAKSDHWLCYACQSAWNNSAPTGRIFMKFDSWVHNSYRKIQQDPTVCQKCIIPFLYEAQHVSSDTPPIIRSLKRHYQPLVLHTWKVVRRWGCWTLSASSNRNVKQPFTYAKPDAASTVLGSWWWVVCRPKHVDLHINME